MSRARTGAGLGVLAPRAALALLALRQGPRDDAEIRHAIGDLVLLETHHLMVDLRRRGLVAHRAGDVRHYVDRRGLAWLRQRGLDAVPGARAEGSES